jgi:two-component system, NarL family, sensor kinase
VDFALHPIRDHEGRILFLHPTGIDITDLKRVEVELRTSHEDLERRVEERTQALAASLATLESEVELRRTTERLLRELSARSLRLQDEERRRFARDLHDSTGQTLVALKMCLASFASLIADSPKAAGLLNDLEALADEALREIRTISHLLHPPMLDEVGFSSAAQWYVDEFMKRSGIKTTLEISATPRLTKDGELVFFRILQESLTNVVRHSSSPAVDIRLNSDQADAILSIRDYGKGISPKTLASFRETGAGGGVGLGGMKQRVRNLGGHLQVESGGDGTCVTATLPLNDAASAEAEDGRAGQPSTAA